jgi:predicted transcriptional regulator
MKRYAMAKTCEEFINHLEDVLSPALGHHYQAVLGTLNQRIDQVQKWQRQEEGFLRQFMDRLVKPIKAKGMDRKKAVEQALKEVMQTDALRRRVESLDFQRTYKLKTLTPLPEDVHEEFLARVREIVEAILP